MDAISIDKNQISFCGLYCAACSAFTGGRCKGCRENEKASWCKIRECNMQNGYSSCADCKSYSNANDCKLFNNFVGKIFALLFGSNRYGAIQMIKADGYDSYAKTMAKEKRMSPKKK